MWTAYSQYATAYQNYCGEDDDAGRAAQAPALCEKQMALMQGFRMRSSGQCRSRMSARSDRPAALSGLLPLGRRSGTDKGDRIGQSPGAVTPAFGARALVLFSPVAGRLARLRPFGGGRL